MNSIGQRLREERERLALTQTALGALAGVQKNAQVNYEAGRRAADATYFSAIAEAGADVLYILTGRRENEPQGLVTVQDHVNAVMRGELRALETEPLRRSQASLYAAEAPPEPSDPAHYIYVPLHTARLSAGPGAAEEDAPAAHPIAFRADWLRRLGVAARNAMLVAVSGDSMAPTLRDRDLVLVDCARRAPRQGRIYAFNDISGDTRVKRLARVAGAGLLMISDNPESPPELRTPYEADRVVILGEVVWLARALAAPRPAHAAMAALAPAQEPG